MHTHTHTSTHTYIHTYIHAYKHPYIHTYIHTRTHTHTAIHTYTHTQESKSSYVNSSHSVRVILMAVTYRKSSHSIFGSSSQSLQHAFETCTNYDHASVHEVFHDKRSRPMTWKKKLDISALKKFRSTRTRSELAFDTPSKRSRFHAVKPQLKNEQGIHHMHSIHHIQSDMRSLQA